MFERFKKNKSAGLRLSRAENFAISLSGAPEDDAVQQEKFLQLLLKGFEPAVRAHPPTVLCALGALAGFAAQMALRETLVQTGRLREWDVFKIIEAGNGAKYYETERTYDLLLRMKEWTMSVFRMMSETAADLGTLEMYDVFEIAAAVERSYGARDFGMPHVTPAHSPKYNPLDMLKDSWDPLCLCLKMFDGGKPSTWPLTIGAIARRYIYKMQNQIDPSVIVPLVMESAVAMSRVDPRLVCGQSMAAGRKTIDLSKTEFGQLLMSEDFSRAMQNARAAA